jgi:hypothetical protein
MVPNFLGNGTICHGDDSWDKEFVQGVPAGGCE